MSSKTDNRTSVSATRDVGERAGAVTAAVALVAMAVLAPIASFGMLDPLRAAGAEVSGADGASMRLAAALLTAVVGLDVVVAWGLSVAFRRENAGLARLAGWLRLAYAAGFVAAIARLLDASLVVGVDPAATAVLLERFDLVWAAAIAVFAVHLSVVARLLWQPAVFARIVAVLVAVTAAGYLVDGIGSVVSAAYTFEVSTFTFVGEVVLIVWLFARGGRDPLPTAGAS